MKRRVDGGEDERNSGKQLENIKNIKRSKELSVETRIWKRRGRTLILRYTKDTFIGLYYIGRYGEW